MKKIILLIVVFSLSTLVALAQGKPEKNKDKNKPKKNKTEVKDKKHGPPTWAPAHGYRKRHIYFPNKKCYYDNKKGGYYSLDKDKWVFSVDLPKVLKDVDLKNEPKIELDLEDTVEDPTVEFEEHKKQYPK